MSQACKAPRITYVEAVAVYRKPARLARALGVSRASASEWKEKGELPEGRVWQLIALRPDKFGHLQPVQAIPQLELALAPLEGGGAPGS